MLILRFYPSGHPRCTASLEVTPILYLIKYVNKNHTIIVNIGCIGCNSVGVNTVMNYGLFISDNLIIFVFYFGLIIVKIILGESRIYQ